MYTVSGFEIVFHKIFKENWKKNCVEISSHIFFIIQLNPFYFVGTQEQPSKSWIRIIRVQIKMWFDEHRFEAQNRGVGQSEATMCRSGEALECAEKTTGRWDPVSRWPREQERHPQGGPQLQIPALRERDRPAQIFQAHRDRTGGQPFARRVWLEADERAEPHSPGGRQQDPRDEDGRGEALPEQVQGVGDQFQAGPEHHRCFARRTE